MMRADLDHLPEAIRRELEHVVHVLFEEFAEAVRGKQATHRKTGRVLKLILFGAFAHPDWRERDAGDGLAAFDILVIVNHDELADLREHWRFAIDRLYREWKAGRLLRPVRLTVHSLAQVNRALVNGVPFFVSIAETGIALYQMDDRPLAMPRHLPAGERRARAGRAFRTYFPMASDFLAGALFFRDRGNRGMAALLLHQACEHFYHSVLWTFTLHDRRTHALHELRDLAEQLDGRLVGAWPRATRFERRAFACIRRAYLEVRYSTHYRIGDDELAWASERVERLHLLVDEVCRDHLATLREERPVLLPAEPPAGRAIVPAPVVSTRAPVPARPVRQQERFRFNRLIRKGLSRARVPAAGLPLAAVVGALMIVLYPGHMSEVDTTRGADGQTVSQPGVTVRLEAPGPDDDWPDHQPAERKPASLSAILDFDLPAGRLADAARKIATDAGYEFMSDAAIWQDRWTEGFRARATTSKALQSLLYGTGLCPSIEDGAVMVRRCRDGGSAARGRRPSLEAGRFELPRRDRHGTRLKR
jgi:HEPN domain-containing protein